MIQARKHHLVYAWVTTLLVTTACEGEGIWQKPHFSFERMDEQLSDRPYARNDMFRDGRAMRPPPVGSEPWQPTNETQGESSAEHLPAQRATQAANANARGRANAGAQVPANADAQAAANADAQAAANAGVQAAANAGAENATRADTDAAYASAQAAARTEPSISAPSGASIPAPSSNQTNARNAERSPPTKPLTRADLEEGRTLFDTFCAVCHGILGEGDTVVADHMRQVKPTRLASAHVRTQRDDQLVRTTLQGYGLMAGFADRLSQRQAQQIAGYIRALQLSQDIAADTLPPKLRAELNRAQAPQAAPATQGASPATPSDSDELTPVPRKMSPEGASQASPRNPSKGTPVPRQAPPEGASLQASEPVRNAAPQPARDAEPSPTRNVEPNPARSANPSPTRNAEPSPARNAEPSPARNAEPNPARNAEPNPTRSANPSPARKAEPSPTRNANPEPARSAPARGAHDAAPERPHGARPQNAHDVPHDGGTP